MSKATNRELAEAVYTLSRHAKDGAALADSIAEYLVAERRTRDLDKIMREVEKLRFARDDQLEIVTTSARPLNDSVRTAIGRLFEGKDITIVEQLEPALVGGVSIQALDEQLDLSIRGQLKRLRNSNFREG